MNTALSLLIGASLAAQSVALPPRGVDFTMFHKASGDWNRMRSYYDPQKVYEANTLMFHQEAKPIGQMDINLISLTLYNLDTPGCVTPPLRLTYNDDQNTNAKLDFNYVTSVYPCFKNGDQVFFAADLATFDGKTPSPVLFPNLFKINTEQTTAGFKRVGVEYSISFENWHNRNEGTDLSFLWDKNSVGQEADAIGNCPLPTADELKVYSEAPQAASKIFMQPQDRLSGPQVLQVAFVPDRPGCSNANPITMYNFGDKPITFPQDCYGTAYASFVYRDDDFRPTCGAKIPLRIPINPKAELSQITLPNTPAAATDYTLSTGRCAVQQQATGLTPHTVGQFTVHRDTSDIKDTKIEQIRFYRDEQCQAVWNMKDGSAGSIETISASSIVYGSSCLRDGDLVSLQYRLADTCQGVSFWVQTKAILSIKSKINLDIYFPGNRPERSLGQLVHRPERSLGQLVHRPSTCPMPTEEELAKMKLTTATASKIEYSRTYKIQPVALELRMLPMGPGCPDAGPLKTVTTDINSKVDASFSITCRGNVIVTFLHIDENTGEYKCQSRLPAQLQINPRAEATTMTITNNAQVTDFLYVTPATQCPVLPLKSDAPIFEVGRMTMTRDTPKSNPQIGVTKIILKNKYCEAEWKLNSTRSGYSETIDLAEFYAYHACLKGTTLDILYGTDYCKNTQFVFQSRVRFVPGKDLIMHFPGDQVEAYLDHYPEVIDTLTTPSRGLRS